MRCSTRSLMSTTRSWTTSAGSGGVSSRPTHLRSGADVLDLACGRGAVLEPALAAVGERGSVLGIDLAPAMVTRLGAELAQRHVTNVEVRVGDAERLDVPDASFDAVTGGFMIFFPPEPRRVLGRSDGCCAPMVGSRCRSTTVRPGSRSRRSWRRRSGWPGGSCRRDAPSTSWRCCARRCSEAGFWIVGGVEMWERFRFRSEDEVERWQRSTGVRRVLSHWMITGSRGTGPASPRASNHSGSGRMARSSSPNGRSPSSPTSRPTEPRPAVSP